MLIGSILEKKYNVDKSDIEKALQFQQRFGGVIGSILINMGIISEETLISALSEQLDIDKAQVEDVEKFDLDNYIKNIEINNDFLINRRWIPAGEIGDEVFFVSSNPIDLETVQYLMDFPFKWRVLIGTEAVLREYETRYSIKKSQEEIDSFDISDLVDSEIDRLKELATEAPVVNLVNSLISRAVGRGASDLHLEPYKNMYRVRFRIDGKLHDIDFLPLKMQLPVASRIKILSGMDIAEKRRPQDGKISTKVASMELDIRVSTLPLAEGESLVLRFLMKESVAYELENLGFEPDLQNNFLEDIKKSSGVILLTGPTGSGKTTTLYSCLNKINSEDKKIITIENPVEYQLDGINQININQEIGYDFLTALRSILRQDPDILMVGEIRDGETARVAMQSSLTGHLVFSTIHTNDAATAYTRLIDLGVEEYLINSSLISAIAQRLVRKLCPFCSVNVDADPAIIKTYDLEKAAQSAGLKKYNLKRAVGCPECNGTGYKGRVAILEYLRCTPQIKSFKKDGSFLSNVYEYREKENIRSLLDDGLVKVVKGVTTIDEVSRVCG